MDVINRNFFAGLKIHYPEQKQAIFELLNCTATTSIEDLEGIAEWAHEQLSAKVDCYAPSPQVFAWVFDLVVMPDDGLPSFSVLHNRIIKHRHDTDKKRVGFAVLHEIAEYLLREAHVEHVDIWLLSFMLIIPRSECLSLVRRVGVPRATTFLSKRCRHVPAWSIAIRLFFLVAEVEAA